MSSFGFARVAAAQPAVASVDVQVGTRAQEPVAVIQAASWTRLDGRYRFVAGETGITTLRLGFVNYLVSSGLLEVTSGNPITLDCAVEISAAQARFGDMPAPLAIRAFFNGQANVTLADGATVHSDPIPVFLPPGAEYWVRSSVLVNASEFVPVAYQSNAPGEVTVAGTGASQALGTGPLVGGTIQSVGFGPASVRGRAPRWHPTVLVLGDSIAYGQGESAGDGLGNRGFTRRGLAGIRGHTLPSLLHARASDRLFGQLQYAQPRKRVEWATF